MLPYNKLPQGCAWGWWDRPRRNEFGIMNSLTRDRIAAGVAEIKHVIVYKFELREPLFWRSLRLMRLVAGHLQTRAFHIRRSKLKHYIIDDTINGSTYRFNGIVCLETE